MINSWFMIGMIAGLLSGGGMALAITRMGP